MITERIFVFRESRRSKDAANRTRPLLYAIPESKILDIQSQWGSQNCYLLINGLEVEGSFEDFIKVLGVPCYCYDN